MKKVLLVNPPVYDFAAFDLWAKPLGSLYLSSVLKKHNIEVNMFDYMDRHYSCSASKSDKYGCGHYHKIRVGKPEVLKSIPRYFSRYGIPRENALNFFKNLPQPDLIIITSVMTYWYPGVYEAIETIRRVFPGVPIALGGAYATLCPEHAQNTKADFLVKGPLFRLNDVLESFSVNVDIPKDFNFYPAPDYSSYNKKEYVCLRTSFGCPFNCSYCAQNILCEDTYTYKTPGTVFNEIESFAVQGINNFVFYDDALLYNPDKIIKPLLERIIKSRLGINIHTPNGLHARYLDKELAILMKKAGFIKPRFSLETASPSLQKKTGGKINNETFEQSIEYLKQAGYGPGEYIVYLLMGMPGQSFGDIEESIKYVNSLGAVISLSEYSVIPRTADFEKLDPKYAKEPLYHNKSAYPLFAASDFNKIMTLKNIAKNLNSML